MENTIPVDRNVLVPLYHKQKIGNPHLFTGYPRSIAFLLKLRLKRVFSSCSGNNLHLIHQALGLAISHQTGYLSVKTPPQRKLLSRVFFPWQASCHLILATIKREEALSNVQKSYLHSTMKRLPLTPYLQSMIALNRCMEYPEMYLMNLS